MSRLSLVYALFGSAGAAEEAARDAIEQRLAACANILGGCRSVYRWEGAVQTADEVPVLFKTMPERRAALMAHLAAGHSYDVPAIIALPPAEALADFAAWVAAETLPG